MSDNKFRLAVSGTSDGEVSTDWLLTNGGVVQGDSTDEPALTMTIGHKAFVQLTEGDLCLGLPIARPA